jgi:hypothetical protein
MPCAFSSINSQTNSAEILTPALNVGSEYVDANTLDPSIALADDTPSDQRCPRFPRD